MRDPCARPFLIDDLPEEIVAQMVQRDAWLHSLPEGGGDTLEFLIDTTRRWRNGSVLRVAFLDGDEELHARIEGAAREISDACGLRLEARDENGAFRRWTRTDTEHRAEIRISFDLPGYFSLVGTDSVNLAIGQPEHRVGGRPWQTSLNLGGFTVGLPEDWRRTALHELLHALGVLHEHTNLDGPCQRQFRWEDDAGYSLTLDARGVAVPDGRGLRPGIYTYLAHAPNRWSRAKVDMNLRPMPGQGIEGGSFDRASVMLYQFDSFFYRDGADNPCAPITTAGRLSEGDRAGLQRLYPRPSPLAEVLEAALSLDEAAPALPPAPRRAPPAALAGLLAQADPQTVALLRGGEAAAAGAAGGGGAMFPRVPLAGALLLDREETTEGLFGFGAPRAWEHTEHQVGHISPPAPGQARLPVVAAGMIEADRTLAGTQVDIRLDRLRVHAYPGGRQRHEVLVTFKAHNAGRSVDEVVTFSQAFQVQEGQGAGVRGHPVFLGLSVGGQGLAFQFTTVNVHNEGDRNLLGALRSDGVKGGLGLLTTAQPALKPLCDLAMGLAQAALTRNENRKVQDLYLGLDFHPQGTGVGLRLGSYVAVQVPHPGAVDWSQWVFDRQREAIVHAQDDSVFPYNYLLFRVSPHEGAAASTLEAPGGVEDPEDALRAEFAEDAGFKDGLKDGLEAPDTLELPTSALGRQAVRLVADEESPCLRHLAAPRSDLPFLFSAQVLQRLVDANRFGEGLAGWGGDLVLFGLRGCRLADDPDGFPPARDLEARLGFSTDAERLPRALPLWASTGGFVREVALVEDTVTHVLPRCLIGVWRRSTGEVALVRGTTAPNWDYTASAIAARAGRDAVAGTANMMLTGLYRYKVGHHKRIPDAFRLVDSDHGAVRVAAQDKREICYTVRDRYWNVGSWPSQDNLHPSMAGEGSARRFLFHYSAGCSTVQGRFDEGRQEHQGAWAELRGYAGLSKREVDHGAIGRAFSYVLLTGREARLAAEGVPGPSLARLRFGARGAEIEALQQVLGRATGRDLGVTGRFDGPTQAALVAWQWTQGLHPGSWDAVLAPLEAARLGLVLA